MELVFEETEQFEKDLSKFSPRDRKIVADKINRLAINYQENPQSFSRNTMKIRRPTLANGLSSSLYLLRINFEIRAICTIDLDPIFDQLIFTLLRVVHHKDLDKAYRSILSSLYQKYLLEGEAEELPDD